VARHTATERQHESAADPEERIRDFDEFVRARHAALVRFGRALTGDEHRGADLVQDALERALPRWRRIAARDPEAYVRRTMVNRNISVWRSRRREHLSDEVPDVSVETSGHDEVWAAIRLLPPRQRTVIALRYLADQTESQTAELMGCSVGTVKSQASAAMRKLRDLLDDSEEER
jgi:RNA polymerase sigma-70 factor (sigma-E family)